MNIVELTKWGQLKGIQVMGTGDFTHPRWFKELQERLEPAEPGLYKLGTKFAKEIQAQVPTSCQTDMRFVPTVEVSCIYKKNDHVRKMHVIIVSPKLEYAQHIGEQLGKIGNIKHDGRPILGLDAKRLLEIVLDVSEDNLFIPAHAWTPHFSVFGSQSGFDSLTEAFDELTPHIYAIETGLSSDPAMNWRLSALDNIALISNSDAHSAKKLGREANVFNTELSYTAIAQAIKTNDLTTFESTIEFYPQEGKYHLDGHRTCQVRLEPAETKKLKGLCPECGKSVIVGVQHRVDDLADRADKTIRSAKARPKNARPFHNIIPLPEIIAEVVQKGVNTKTVDTIYFPLLKALGNEFHILLEAPIQDIAAHSSPMVAEAVRRMRDGKVHIAAGYDGEFGTIKIFEAKERKQFSGPQGTLL